jgi:hypothetical protein
MIYFGCIGETGHFLHRPDLRHSSAGSQSVLAQAGIWPKCDGGFCPGMEEAGGKHHKVEQVEGAAKVTHLDGWTILAFWDRSVDHRRNSNSAFIERGTLSFDEMVSRAKKAFPTVWKRFPFKVRRTNE